MRLRHLLAAALTAPALAQAQGSYPDRAVRLIVPFPPGGGTDTCARITTEGMQPEFDQPIVTCSPEMLPIFGRVCFSRGRTNETQQVQR